MLKIKRSANGKIVFTLSGRIEIEDVAELQRLLALELSDHNLALDLADVTLVDREAVKFLARLRSGQHRTRELSALHSRVDSTRNK